MSEIIKHISLLGSTGSIGTQTLDIVAEHPECLKVEILTAGKNWKLLAEQALRFRPKRVVIADVSAYGLLKDALAGSDIEVSAGSSAIAEAAEDSDIDTVVTAMVGYSGLEPTIRAVKSGKEIALANKETLVVGGNLINHLLKKSKSRILPVDSEHSAIFQCLEGEDSKNISKIVLTASGGPFRTFSVGALENVTVEDALKHPKWDMGAKVTIDSASMMNKGFEMIEAHHLFGCDPDKIEVAVHPQSIVHSMVEFIDGSMKAQLGPTDMHLPIRYALGYPRRLKSSATSLSLKDYSNLTFESPDMNKFPLLAMAYEAIKVNGTAPCILNAANEIAVALFLNRRIRFTDMPRIAEQTLQKVKVTANPDYEDLIETNEEARTKAQEIAERYIF